MEETGITQGCISQGWIGQWRLKNGLLAEVTDIDATKLIGKIRVYMYDNRDTVPYYPIDVPSFWNKEGNSTNSKFDLLEKRRSEEQKW